MDGSRVTLSGGELNPFAKVFLGNNNLIHKTNVSKHTKRPVWDSPKEFLCSDREGSVITVKIVDDRDFLKDPVVGYMSIRLQQLLDAKKDNHDWFPLSGIAENLVAWSSANTTGRLQEWKS